MKTDRLPSLLPLRDNEFLPPINRWMVAGGMVLMGAVISAIGLAAVLPYNVAVQAAATVRPSGELRLVQAAQAGTIAQIEVEANQPVQQGQIIARLDSNSLDTQQRQLQGSIQQAQLQITQMQAQIGWIDTQIAAESRSLDRSLAIAQAELDVSQQSYQQQQTSTQTDLAAAEASLTFAQSEMRRYQELVASGAVSPLQLEEKQAAVQAAAAQVARARAGLNPSPASVTIAQERIAQASAQSQASLATLEREREALIQQQAALQAQLIREQAELQRIEADRQRMVIRASSSGILFQLNLRNPGQVIQAGETIATIAPQSAPLLFKAAIAPQDINQVKTGQSVQLRLDACPFPDYGTLAGRVVAISPDALASPPDAASGNAASDNAASTVASAQPTASRYFEVIIQPTAQTLTNQNRSCPLQAGMRAEATLISRQETGLQLILRTARLLVR